MGPHLQDRRLWWAEAQSQSGALGLPGPRVLQQANLCPYYDEDVQAVIVTALFMAAAYLLEGGRLGRLLTRKGL